MAGSVRDLPGVRLGARAFLYAGGDEEGVATRVEDFDADWVGVAQPDLSELGQPVRRGDPVEIEIPTAGGSLFLVGKAIGHCVERSVGVILIRVEEVGADPGVGNTREARQHFRQPLWLPLRRLTYKPQYADDWREVGGIARDLSAGGLSVFADGEVPVGSAVVVDCPVPLEPSGMMAKGTSVGCRRTGTERRPRYIVNVRFDSLSRHERGWLTGQLHRYQWLTRWRSR